MHPSSRDRPLLLLRPHVLLISLVSFLCMAALLKSSWGTTFGRSKSSQINEAGKDEKDGQSMIALPGTGINLGKHRMVFAHFMLGNTYPFTPADWTSTLLLASQTGLDALALNLGPESWQTDQLIQAYTILSTAAISTGTVAEGEAEAALPSGVKLKLFISLDMTVLPSASEGDMNTLVDLVVKCGKMDAQLIVPETMQHKESSSSGGGILNILPLKRHGGRAHQGTAKRQLGDVGKGKVMLSTFGGESASFGGRGWTGFIEACAAQGVDIFFAPAFFLPPSRLLTDASLAVDAPFNWNSGWPTGDTPITEGGNGGEKELMDGDKPYMAAISPWFFTHYGKTGDHAYNKNWIYRSDDNLYATRWNQVLELDPQFVEVLTWNDYGESHYIGPILGAQPGSETWTAGMDHEAWRLMTKDFIRMFKGLGPVSGDLNTIKLYLSYRTASKNLVASDDSVGRPRDADWARDVIAIYALAPLNGLVAQGLTLTIITGGQQTQLPLVWDKRGQFVSTVGFAPGPVSFTVTTLAGVPLLEEQGVAIQSESEIYNFNAWTGHWTMGL